MATKKAKTQEEQVPFAGPEAVMEVSGAEPAEPKIEHVPVPVATKPQTTALAKKAECDPEVFERLQEAIDALESFNGIQLPLVRFKESFKMSEDGEELESFEGIILFTKESNVYYKERFKPGIVMRPDCFSPDGKKPTTDKPQHGDCLSCPHNQFGSAKEGDGKACKNTRPVFVLVRNPETKEFGVIPKVLRIPPTSLTLVRSYCVNVAADFGALHNVVTKFEVFQKSQNQTHHNIKFTTCGRLTAQEKANILAIRDGWMPLMKQGNFGIDEETAAGGPTPPAAGAPGVDEETRF